MQTVVRHTVRTLHHLQRLGQAYKCYIHIHSMGAPHHRRQRKAPRRRAVVVVVVVVVVVLSCLELQKHFDITSLHKVPARKKHSLSRMSFQELDEWFKDKVTFIASQAEIFYTR